ncbi:MAG: transaldolase [Proteobacteria bacterium]|nr:transaldolase [Pseudomonadota bacterium]
MNQLEQLKKYTKVVADTGDINSIAQYQPQDATTNPTLILKAATLPEYQELIQSALDWAKKHFVNSEDRLHGAVKKLLVNFGVKILAIIPGRVSTEVDAGLSFDIDSTVHQAQELIQLYHQAGIGRERVLIKIASTWEGIQAANILEKQGIHCNLTLMFEFVQAVACAQAGVTLISPFVGRIFDWYQKNEPQAFDHGADPGVASVKKIYQYLHAKNYPTTVMGASFRNLGQIQALAGCDCLTISPNLLKELQNCHNELPRALNPQETSAVADMGGIDEKTFRWLLNENAMATEKLAEGIRLFNKDLRTLEKAIQRLL